MGIEINYSPPVQRVKMIDLKVGDTFTFEPLGPPFVVCSDGGPFPSMQFAPLKGGFIYSPLYYPETVRPSNLVYPVKVTATVEHV